MKLYQLMKEDPAVITVDCTIREAAHRMKELNAGILPVVEGGKGNESRRPIGVLTDRDITIRATAEGKDTDSATVEEVFTRDTVFCYDEDTAQNAFQKMIDNDVGRLLVKRRGEDLAGIVTMADIIANVPEEIFAQLRSRKEPQKQEEQMDQTRINNERERIQDRVGEFA